MTAKRDAIGSHGPDAALSHAAAGDSPLTIFEPEPQEVGIESSDSAALRMDAVPSQAPSVSFATPSVKDGKPRTAGVVNRIKRVLRTLDIARDVEKTVDSRLAALRGLDQEVQDRAGRLERLNQEIVVGVTHADDVLRAIGSFERPLADLRRHKQDLREIETTVAAFENRAQTASTSLGRLVASWEARQAAVVDAAEQLGRRAADTIEDLEGRVGDCEARAHIAEQAITTSLTALEERLPEVGQCDQDLARIELAVPQIARQLEDLNEIAEQQSRVLAARQQLVRSALDESQKTAAVVSELEGRIVDLQRQAQRYQQEHAHRTTAIVAGLGTRMAEIGRTHRELDVAERHVEQLEQRAAAAADEVRHATRATEVLQREIAKCQQQIERLTTAAQGEAEKLNGLRRHADFHEAERASSPSAHDLWNTLRFRKREPNTRRVFSPARLIFGGAASALFAAILFLVSIVWRISPVENQRPENPLSAVALASRALTLAPAPSLAPPTTDISDDRPKATRPAPVPAVPVQPVVVPETPVATSGVTAAAREQSVRKETTPPHFVGSLLIESDPAGAAAFVNQESVGDTPVLVKNLRVGSYVVRLEFKGYQRWSSAATVSAVRQERVKAKLEREHSR